MNIIIKKKFTIQQIQFIIQFIFFNSLCSKFNFVIIIEKYVLYNCDENLIVTSTFNSNLLTHMC